MPLVESPGARLAFACCRPLAGAHVMMLVVIQPAPYDHLSSSSPSSSSSQSQLLFVPLGLRLTRVVRCVLVSIILMISRRCDSTINMCFVYALCCFY